MDYLIKIMKLLEMIDVDTVSEDMKVFTDLGISSLEIMELIIFIEKDKNINIPADAMNFDEQMTLRGLSDIINNYCIR